MAEEGIKLPGSSFDEVAKVIQGYADIGKAVPLDDVSRRIGMHPTVISRNNGFLVFVGVLEGGKNKAITATGKSLANALSHNIEAEVQRILQSLVDDNDFLRNIVSSVRIRKGMDESSLRAHIAYSAGLAKSQSTMTGTGTVLEILRRAGVLIEQDGKFVSATPVAPALGTHEPLPTENAVDPTSYQANVRPMVRASGVSVQIEVRIDCKPSDLDGLGDQLKKLLDEIEGRSSVDATSEG